MDKARVRLGLRTMRFNAIERGYDLWNIFLPVFLVTGMLAICLRFWMWALGF